MKYHVRIVDAKGEGCILSVKDRTEWKTKACARRHAAGLTLSDFGAVKVELRDEFNEVIETVQGEPGRMAPLWSWEYTDTFDGETNYSWVKRGTIEAYDARAAVRLAKKAAGLTGAPCRREEQGDCIALYPAGTCTVLFITEDY